MERSNIGSWLVPAAALLLPGTESLRVAPKEDSENVMVRTIKGRLPQPLL